MARGVDELEEIFTEYGLNEEPRKEAMDMWTKLTELVSKGTLSSAEAKTRDKLIDDIATMITDWHWNAIDAYKKRAVNSEDKVRVKESEIKTRTVGKKEEAYTYSEWENRIWSLPDVMNVVIKSITKSLIGQASFAKKIGLSKASSVTNALKNGQDFPQGHKKPSAAA